MIIDYIGWAGALMLSICGLPQAILTLKKKNANGISHGFIQLWFWGEVGQLIYVINNQQYPIIFNCSLNILLVGVIMWYKIFPKK